MVDITDTAYGTLYQLGVFVINHLNKRNSVTCNDFNYTIIIFKYLITFR